MIVMLFHTILISLFLLNTSAFFMRQGMTTAHRRQTALNSVKTLRQSKAFLSCPKEYVIKESPGKGLGVFTLTCIPLNTVVGDYTGELLTLQQKDRLYLPSLKPKRTQEDLKWIESRLERGQTITGDYIFGVGDFYVDAEDTDVSNWCRFLNHDGDANLRVKSLEFGMDDKPRIWFVANRDIQAGEELCFDYGEGYWMDDDIVK
mmetsp:Transcript_12863/g.26255  ORF Transcript_12863/g.26255 Transcript_12863/m.26255 type:complete len:204 (+) Transcript_12863:114-725(+)|eukprot:CAMPEP_0118644390 /NCGR_PEP_ID=MMETSP0785-20121206/6920_1 /TAXON_ID=91992 /ORGANISM="Bolidomonas pacifica, Strain CCMP 1866" /LENGTH=203 /DNA_ID=CAMNT_0006536159 /DNA_START=93 /DNA_END=704 /DNA_ORIENTATION=-